MTVRFGDFVLVPESRQLLRRGKDVRLSPKAFDLLCTLVANRPNVMSKGDLIAKIWPATFVLEANLNVLIGEIRRALGDASRSPRFVRTVHGIGYAFCGDASELDGAPAGEGPRSRCCLVWGNRTFVLSRGENTIGRDPGSDVWVEHPDVSRRHACIRVSDDSTAYLDDLQSTNGTFVGTKRLHEQTPVHDGDVIRVGSVQLRFRVSGTTPRTRRIRSRD